MISLVPFFSLFLPEFSRAAAFTLLYLEGVSLPLVAFHPMAKSANCDGETGATPGSQWQISGRKSPQTDPKLSLLLRASGRERIPAGTLKSARFLQATHMGEVLILSCCRETSVECAAGFRDIPSQLPLGEDIALDPSLSML